jgi:hypothetical protein
MPKDIAENEQADVVVQRQQRRNDASCMKRQAR